MEFKVDFMNIAELGELFKSARVESRQTQKDIMLATGISIQTISKLERGALIDIGLSRLLSLFRQVGLELFGRPAGQRRTLEDVAAELNAAGSLAPSTRKLRVRRTLKEKA